MKNRRRTNVTGDVTPTGTIAGALPSRSRSKRRTAKRTGAHWSG